MTRLQIAAPLLVAAGVLLVGVTACDAGSADSTQRLAGDAQRLQAALRHCRERVAPADDPACRAASAAWRRHFFGAPETAQAQRKPPAAKPTTDLPTPAGTGS